MLPQAGSRQKAFISAINCFRSLQKRFVPRSSPIVSQWFWLCAGSVPGCLRQANEWQGAGPRQLVCLPPWSVARRKASPLTPGRRANSKAPAFRRALLLAACRAPASRRALLLTACGTPASRRALILNACRAPASRRALLLAACRATASHRVPLLVACRAQASRRVLLLAACRTPSSR